MGKQQQHKTRAPGGRIEALLFDLDGTLYPTDNGYEDHVRNRITLFMVEKLGVETMELAAALWEVAFRRYNQSLRGLRAAGYKLDENAYWEFIRAGADRFLTPDSGVKALLESLPQRKWLFTNCRELEAKQALTLLGLDGFFEGIIGADAMGLRCKPDEEVFRRAFAKAGVDPRRTALFEDSAKNIETAKRLGMYTILVDGRTRSEEGLGAESADCVVPACTLTAVRAVVPQLWQVS